MKFLDLFAGIGGFRLGLEQAGHECVGFCEIDKFARQSYKAIHNTEGEREYHDITTVSNEEWRTLRGTVELICGGFPCQAFSIAGKRKGFLDETRGTLFFEIARAAEQIKPRTLFLENVRGLLSHDKGRTFRTIISTLNELGYDAEWQILNSKNFGVPQNRERVFIIGHLRGERRREVFPIGESNRETNDELKIKIVGNTNNAGHGQKSAVYSADGIMSCLTATDYKQPKQIVVVNKENGMPRETNRVYSPEGLSPTLNTMQGGGREPKIAIKIKEATKQGFAVAELGDSINFSVPNSKTRRGRVGKQVAQTLDTSCNQAVIVQKQRGNGINGNVYDSKTAQDRHGVAVLRPVRTKYGKEIRKAYENGEVEESRHNMTKLEPRQDGISNTITTVQKDNLLKVGGIYTGTSDKFRSKPMLGLSRTLKANKYDAGIFDGVRIRKLTPRECWRLQGFPDWAFDKAQEVNSNSQLYKQAGNSVTVPVIYEIARRFE
ncbi:DNA (cytosine-5-)-methyltransferase [Lactococcus lactis]|uniref:DNA (cytosine-5-)-methyltransferase n=1 Tax=Lactococcus lactis TaxID=1358 RepID=UPI00325D2447